jgi:hypothetical protein
MCYADIKVLILLQSAIKSLNYNVKGFKPALKHYPHLPPTGWKNFLESKYVSI